jgi:hypothetical protein
MKLSTFLLIALIGMLVTYGCSPKKYSYKQGGDPKRFAKKEGTPKPTDENSDFTAQLSALNEVPANHKISATGKAYFRIKEDSTLIYYTLNIKNLKNITKATINYGTEDYNGPRITTIYPARYTETDSLIGRTFSGTLRSFTINTRAVENGALKHGGTVRDVIRIMKNDSAYIQVDTKYHRKGAIRGQIR